MKALKIFSVLFLSIAFTNLSYAQDAKTETIPVSGNCGMCKDKIEKAAKEAGAKDAEWNVETKTLTIKYSAATTNTAKIQQGIAAVGYDTRDVKAADEAYDKLHGCCKYDRKSLKKEEKPGTDAAKAKADCCKKEDGKTASKDGKEQKSCCSEAH